MYIFLERETHMQDQSAASDTVNRLVEESCKDKY